MAELFFNNIGTILVGLILTACLTGAIVYVIRSKRKGKCIGCDCACGEKKSECGKC